MVNPRRIYYRKKGKSLIIEGKRGGKSIYIWTLPKSAELFLRELIKASYFPKDKANRIMTLLNCLDYRLRKGEIDNQEVRTINIVGSQEKDENDITK